LNEIEEKNPRQLKQGHPLTVRSGDSLGKLCREFMQEESEAVYEATARLCSI
jgi:hypothetical protein